MYFYRKREKEQTLSKTVQKDQETVQKSVKWFKAPPKQFKTIIWKRGPELKQVIVIYRKREKEQTLSKTVQKGQETVQKISKTVQSPAKTVQNHILEMSARAENR